MEKQKGLASNYIYNMLYQLLAILAPLITTPYVSRILEADGLGEYSYVLSIVTYFGLFGKLGLDVYGQLKIASERNDKKRMSATFYGVFLARCITTLVATGAYVLLLLQLTQYRQMYTVLLIFMVGQLFDVTWFFQGLEDFKAVLLRNSLIKLLCLVLVFVCVKTKEDLYLYAFLLQGSVLVGNVSMLPKLRGLLGKSSFRGSQLRKHLKGSLVYFIPTVATSVYTLLDKSMIGWFTGSAFENGYYEQAHKIEQILVTVVTSLSTVTLPRLKHMFTQGQTQQAKTIIHTSAQFILAISLPMTAGIFVMAPTVIPWFLGEGYGQCVPLLQVFSALMLVVGMNNIVGKQCLMAADRQKYYNYGVIAGAVANAVLNCALIPVWGALGAAVASVAGESVILGVFLWHGREYLTPRSLLLPMLRYGAFAVIMGVAVWFAGRWAAGTVGILLQLTVGIGVYGLLLLLFRDPLVKKGFATIKNKRKCR